MNKGRDIVRERTKYSLLSTIIGLGLTVAVGRAIQPCLPEREDKYIPKVEVIQDNHTPEQIRHMEELYE